MKLLKSTALVSSMTLISRVLGLLREVVFARWFGASAATDAFFVAFKIPNFLRRLFAEGSFSLAFVPILSEYREKGDEQALKSLIDAVTGTLLSVLLLITAIGIFAAPVIMMVFAPGWYIDGRDSFELATHMLRITFPYILLISLTALAGGILNTFERFLLPALTPALLNISFITAAVCFSDQFEQPVEVLAWAVLVAGVLQLLVQVPTLAKHGLLPRPRWGWKHSGVRRILKLMIPTLIGSSVAQINLLFDTLIASFLIVGSVSWLSYSDRLMEFPIGVFGVALSTVILPSLARKHTATDKQAFSATIDWALRLALIITIPAAVALAVLAVPLLATMFQYQAFTADDVFMSSLSLMAYAAGLPAFIAIKVLAPGFYARQDTKTPMKIGIFALVINMVFNLAFVGSMLWLDIPGAHAGLALASGASAWLNAGLLYRALRKQRHYLPEHGWLRVGLAVTIASLMMGLGLYLTSPDISNWGEFYLMQRVTWLAGLILLGVVIYAFSSLLFGLRLHDLKRGAEH